MDKYSKKKKYIYIKVTRDKYEFPIRITDSVVEMAKLEHTTENSISSSISHNKGTYFRIEVDEDE